MKKKYGTVDGYLLADIATIVTGVLFVLFVERKVNNVWFALSMMLCAAAIIYSAFIAKATVKNNSNGMIYCKDESSGSVFGCNPSERVDDIDGVKIGNTVYKIPDGVHAVVMVDNSVKILSFWGRLIYHVQGGKLVSAPDENWKDLFSV